MIEESKELSKGPYFSGAQAPEGWDDMTAEEQLAFKE